MPPRAAMVSPQQSMSDNRAGTIPAGEEVPHAAGRAAERAAASERRAGTVGRRERPAEQDPEPNSARRQCLTDGELDRAADRPYNAYFVIYFTNFP